MKAEIDSPTFKDGQRLVKDWQARARAVERQFLYRAAKKVYDEVRDALPGTAAPLRDSLCLARITGLQDNAYGYAIHSKARGQAIGQSDVSTTVLYVEPKSTAMKATPEAVKILIDYGPWTLETLPYQPGARDAVIISRQVSREAVTRVDRDRRKDRTKWKAAMDKAGIREVSKTGRLRLQQRTKALPDTEFESVRLEFGLGGMSVPHWRPAITQLALRGGAGMIARKREFTRAMTDPNFTAWKKWPRNVAARVTVGEVRKYVPFQKKLGIRVKG